MNNIWVPQKVCEETVLLPLFSSRRMSIYVCACLRESEREVFTVQSHPLFLLALLRSSVCVLPQVNTLSKWFNITAATLTHLSLCCGAERLCDEYWIPDSIFHFCSNTSCMHYTDQHTASPYVFNICNFVRIPGPKVELRSVWLVWLWYKCEELTFACSTKVTVWCIR